MSDSLPGAPVMPLETQTRLIYSDYNQSQPATLVRSEIAGKSYLHIEASMIIGLSRTESGRINVFLYRNNISFFKKETPLYQFWNFSL